MKHYFIKFIDKKYFNLSIAVFVSLLLTGGGVLFYKSEESTILQQKQNQIKSIATLKINQLEQWIWERTAGIKLTAESPFFIENIQYYLNNRTNFSIRKKVKYRLELFKDNYGYKDIFLFSKNAGLLLHTGKDMEEFDQTLKKRIAETAKNKNINFTDFYLCPLHKIIHYDILIPVRSASGSTIAVLLIRINPNDYLYPLIQSWPVPSVTAETLIVRKDNDSVLFLNELRLKKNTALKLRIPLTENNVPAVQAVSGYTGIFEGLDYRGKKVLAYIEPVQGTNWFMISKIDIREVYSELYFRAVFITLFTTLLIFLTVTSFILKYNSKQKKILQELLDSETRLRKAQEEHKTVLYSIGDAVITTDSNALINRMNPVAEELTGWKEDEAKGLPLDNVFRIINEDTRSEVKNPAIKVLDEGIIVGLANHTLLISKEGKEIPIADSGAPVKNHEGEMTGVVIVFRDQTEERKSRKAVQDSEFRLRRFYESGMLGVFYWNMDGDITDANDKFLEMIGYDRNELQNRSIDWVNMTPEEYKHADIESVAELKKTGVNRIPFEKEYIRKDGTRLPVLIAGAMLDERCYNGVAFLIDITDRKNAEEKILKHEKLLNSTLDSLFEGCQIISFDWRYIYLNNTACMHGRYDKNELLGRRIMDVYPGIVNTGVFHLIKRCMEERIHSHFENEFFYEDGTSAWFDLSIQPTPEGVLILSIDITERKRSEEKIKKLNRIYAFLSEINKIIVRTEDQQKLFDDACRIAVDVGDFKFSRIAVMNNDKVITAAEYGFSGDWVKETNNPLSAHEPDSCILAVKAIQEGKFSICNNISDLKLRLPCQDEALELGYFSSAAFPLFKNGRHYGVIILYSSEPDFFDDEEIKLLEELSSDLSYCINTIEQEKQKQKIEEERDRLFNYSIDMMSIIGFDGFFKQLNPAWMRTLEYTDGKLMSEPFLNFVHPEDRESTNKIWKRLIEGEVIITGFLNRLRRFDESYKWMSWNMVTLPETDQVFAVTRDVTDFINNENKRKDLEGQLIKSQRLESLGTLAGGIAHDFNNILNIIMGYASLLKTTELDESDFSGSIDNIMNASLRGADLTKQLLTFARKSESIFQSIQINEIIAELKKLLKETFPKTIELKYELQDDLPMVIADATQIHQVMLNLCVNARDSMENGGTLVISTKLVKKDTNPENKIMPGDSSYVEICVSDTGTGINEETRRKIFEPFFTTKEKGKGTGLGLALVYGIVKNHAGYIDLDSELGKGTIFRIYLPVLEHADKTKMVSTDSVDEDNHHGSGTILLIEDEKSSSELLTSILVLNGYRVITAYDGMQGLMAYQEHKEEIDIVISDHGLPRLSGEEVVRQIKKINPDVKIILVSGYLDPAIKARLLEADIHQIIQKPYIPPKILKTIKKVLEE